MGLFGSIAKGIGKSLGGASKFLGGLGPLGAAVGIGGSILGGMADRKSDQRINNQNIGFQEQQNEITRAREDNAMQRKVKDLEAAGLNKVLAAGGPGAASAPMTAPRSDYKSDIGPDIAQALSMKKDFAVAESQVKLNNMQADKIKAEEQKIISETENVKKTYEQISLDLEKNLRDFRIIKGEELGQRSDVKGWVTDAFSIMTGVTENIRRVGVYLGEGIKWTSNKISETAESIEKGIKDIKEQLPNLKGAAKEKAEEFIRKSEEAIEKMKEQGKYEEGRGYIPQSER